MHEDTPGDVQFKRAKFQRFVLINHFTRLVLDQMDHFDPDLVFAWLAEELHEGVERLLQPEWELSAWCNRGQQPDQVVASFRISSITHHFPAQQQVPCTDVRFVPFVPAVGLHEAP